MSTVTIEPEKQLSRSSGFPTIIPLEIRHRVTIDEYHRMVDLGVYPSGTPIELLEGVLVDKMGKNPPQMICVDLVQDVLGPVVKPGFFLSMGNPVSIEQGDSEPEPDASVIRGTIRDYVNRRRGPIDASLVIEVSDTSYPIDRRHKWSIYGAANIPVYWILNLNLSRLEVFTDPTGPVAESGYRSEQFFGPDDEVPLILDGREVARIVVRDLLP